MTPSTNFFETVDCTKCEIAETPHIKVNTAKYVAYQKKSHGIQPGGYLKLKFNLPAASTVGIILRLRSRDPDIKAVITLNSSFIAKSYDPKSAFSNQFWVGEAKAGNNYLKIKALDEGDSEGGTLEIASATLSFFRPRLNANPCGAGRPSLPVSAITMNRTVPGPNAG